MKLPSDSIAHHKAIELGYKPLTRAFYLPNERAMLDKFQRDLKDIDFVLVGPMTAPEIWRKGMLAV